MASSVGGTSRPSALAVLRLIARLAPAPETRVVIVGSVRACLRRPFERPTGASSQSRQRPCAGLERVPGYDRRRHKPRSRPSHAPRLCRDGFDHRKRTQRALRARSSRRLSGGGKHAPCRRPRSFPSCWTSKGGTSTWCIEFVLGGKVLTIATAGAANSEWRHATGNHRIGDGAQRCRGVCPCHGAPEKRHDGLLVMLLLCALETTQASARRRP